MSWISEHGYKVGFVGTVFGVVFAIPCCIGIPALIVFLSAIGAGFLINERFMLPLVIGSLLLA